MCKQCPICGNPVKPSRQTYCSYKCAGEARQNYKICVICGKRFKSSPSANSVTCSKECATRHRSEVLRDTSNKNLIPARAAAKVSPKAGRFETHHKSKRWVLLSPDGETYEVKNLELFAREHCAEYGATAKQMGDGIRKIKASMQGKRKNPCYQWHGWTLVDGDEL